MIAANNKIYIVAEAGVNHNGSVDLARQLIEAAAQAGADAVKFQTFSAQEMISASAPKAKYQEVRAAETESQYEMIRKLELDRRKHELLIAFCTDCGIEFLSSPFDGKSLKLLMELGVRRLKIPSGEITNGPLILQAAKTGVPLIVSTGMADLKEVHTCLGVIGYGFKPFGNPSKSAFEHALCSEEVKSFLRTNVTLLHCTSAYPTAYKEANILAMLTLKKEFGLRVGYSDHTLGISAAVVASALGARVIEKHLTLDRALPGPDHGASLEPEEFAQLVKSVREVEVLLGKPDKGKQGLLPDEPDKPDEQSENNASNPG